ncbi:Ppx/GppA family phosphatase, partial [Mesorhizobium sp. M7A.F.Ca.CA.001.12.2.1]
MEDHDTGAGAPEVGVSSASQRSADPGNASWQQRRPTELRSADGQAGDAPHKGKPKKRRKRRRGRKVFAREEARPAENRSPAPGKTGAPAAEAHRPAEAAVSPAPLEPRPGQ